MVKRPRYQKGPLKYDSEALVMFAACSGGLTAPMLTCEVRMVAGTVAAAQLSGLKVGSESFSPAAVTCEARIMRHEASHSERRRPRICCAGRGV